MMAYLVSRERVELVHNRMHASFSGPTNDASNDVWFVYDAKGIVWIRQQDKLDTKTSLSKAL
jgi:hypothetical protein